MNRKTILVADDDTPTREAYVAFLRDCGYDVLEAAHGGEAILHVHHRSPDVVLLDIDMPVLDGVETAESLRSCALTTRTRIIAVTAIQSKPQIERMRSLCDDVLTKPCDPLMLESRIRLAVDAAT